MEIRWKRNHMKKNQDLIGGDEIILVWILRYWKLQASYLRSAIEARSEERPDARLRLILVLGRCVHKHRKHLHRCLLILSFFLTGPHKISLQICVCVCVYRSECVCCSLFLVGGGRCASECVIAWYQKNVNISQPYPIINKD